MPPLRQPKELAVLCYSSISFNFGQAIYLHQNSTEGLDRLREFASHLPGLVLENLYSWILQSSSVFVRCDPGEDDRDVLGRHCRYIRSILDVLLHPHIREIDLNNFSIDLRLLGNFSFVGERVAEAKEDFRGFSGDELDGLVVATDETLLDVPDVRSTARPLVGFARAAAGNLRVFRPGIFVIGRPRGEEREEDDGSDEGRAATSMSDEQPERNSLCWHDPQLIIKLVDFCPNLAVLDLEGYDQLNDLVLEYVAGRMGEDDAGEKASLSPSQSRVGLLQLVELTLPKRSFVTAEGFRALLESLPRLQRINHSGKMGQVFASGPLTPNFGSHLPLRHFCQLESMSSGGIADLSEWVATADVRADSLGIQPFDPDPDCLRRIRNTCPNLTRLCLLVRDDALARIAEGLENMPIEELEAHVTWNGTSGLDLFAIHYCNTLSTIDLTILEGYSWTLVSALGQYCPHLSRLRLTLWAADSIEDAEALDLQQNRFPSLTDVSVRCVDPSATAANSFVPEILLFILLGCSSGTLRTAQYQAPLAWLKPEHLEAMCQSGRWRELQMLVLANTCAGERLSLGLESVDLLLETCPDLCALGNLRTWRGIDHFDPSSELFYRSESELSRLKERSKTNNWDIDFEVENIDLVFDLQC